MPNGAIDTWITQDQIDTLRDGGTGPGYNRKEVVQLLKSSTPSKYVGATAYFEAAITSFYPLRDQLSLAPDELGIQDRQRCIIALQTASGQLAPLAIHIYVSLMEGIKPAEIAHIMLLAGLYAGVPHFFGALDVMEDTLAVLTECVRRDMTAPPKVLGKLQDRFDALKANEMWREEQRAPSPLRRPA